MVGVRSTELIARFAGVLAALVTAVLVLLVLIGGPGFNLLNLVTILGGAVASVLALTGPSRKGFLIASASLLVMAFVPAAASVGWLYVPSLVMLVIVLVLR